MEFDERFEARVIRLIAEGVPARHRGATITKDMRLHRDLGIDSLGLAALVFRLEQAFGVGLGDLASDVDVRRMRTVGDAIEVCRRLLRQASTS